MSLFFGVLGNITDEENKLLSRYCDNLCEIKIPNGYLYIRQKDLNIYYKIEENFGFVISGIGLEANQSEFKKLNVDCWKKYVISPFTVSFPDGHYCGISWINNKVFLFNDILGIKHLYIKKDKGKIYFSNNLQTIKFLTKSYQINYTEFFSAWFLNAKINYEPILLGIERINGVSEFRGALQINKVEHEWIPNFNAKVTINDFNLILEKLINFGLNEFDTLSLGLTAGLDSRLLLSYLLKSGKNNWITHTFGGSNLPDVIYSKNISSKLGFNHKIYDYEIPKKENLIKILSKYVSFTNIVIPVSETIQFGMHERFGDNKTLTADGSYGETYRRQMLNRLLISGKEAIYKKDYRKIAEYIKSSRPNIFNDNFKQKIDSSIYESIVKIFELMPSLRDISLENWLDIFAIKIKMPNTTAFSQHCLDTICTALTLFLQPTLLKVGISLPLEDRINGKMFRELINNNAPILKTFPLVKNNYSYPYNFGNKASYVYTKIKSKILKNYEWKLNETILDLSKDYLLNSINQKNFNENDILNRQLITDSVNCYFKGNKQYKHVVEWYLTYNLAIDEI